MDEHKKNTITIEDLLAKFKLYDNDKDDIDLIIRAYNYAYKKHFGVKRISGDDYITHPLNVAMILTDINADAECMAAALLHDTIEDTDSTKEEITRLFGSTVALLVDGVTKINRLHFSTTSEQVAANQRKILVGLSEDVRVIIIKLADRLHNLRTIYVMPVEKQRKKAKETLEILTPVADRLGINKIKSELEDLSLRYLKPDAYFDILEKLNAKKTEMDADVAEMLNDSPRKMRLVADMIRGMEVNRALGVLKFSSKEASARVEKLLRSAIANWEQKNERKAEDGELFVTKIYVDGGATLKRMRPAPQGRGYRIRKRSNHVTLFVDSKNTNDKN